MNEQSVIPQPGWVLVKRNLPAATTPSGLHIPETARTKNRGVTPGESQSVTVIAVSPEDAKTAEMQNNMLYLYDGVRVDLPKPGDTVFVLAQPDNLVPVFDSDWGLVERENGFQVPDFYLFKLSAVAGVVAAQEAA